MRRSSCASIERKVPKAKIQQGIDKCKENIIAYLEDAKIIAKTGRLHHAIISLEFALEEFGKILLIKDAEQKPTGEVVKLDGPNFCNHNFKAEKALGILDPTHKYRVLFETVWARGVWVPEMWGETVISDKTRLACSFVDYVDNDWALGKEINANYFQELVDIIAKEIVKV